MSAFLVAQLVKNLSACNVGGMGLIPGLGRSPGEGKGEILYEMIWKYHMKGKGKYHMKMY